MRHIVVTLIVVAMASIALGAVYGSIYLASVVGVSQIIGLIVGMIIAVAFILIVTDKLAEYDVRRGR